MGKLIEKVSTERKRVRHSKEFKLEAVRLLEHGQKPATQLALELGIRRNQLYKWHTKGVSFISIHPPVTHRSICLRSIPNGKKFPGILQKTDVADIGITRFRADAIRCGAMSNPTTGSHPS